MADGLPLLSGEADIERLHDIARTAAIQTGAKGPDLDRVIAEIFTALAMQANKIELAARQPSHLQLVKG